MTALHYAASFDGFEQVVKILIEHGSNVKLQNSVLIFFFDFLFAFLSPFFLLFIYHLCWEGWFFFEPFSFFLLGWENSPCLCRKSGHCRIDRPIAGFIFFSLYLFFFTFFLFFSFNFLFFFVEVE